ncbi:MAG TPA: hypothetical protein VL485_22305 [Ktedonobacteraceae bacterium]|jgi:hypothetical protein|nr:hypothetical protein [Ktedonobacteraceae bacterium]
MSTLQYRRRSPLAVLKGPFLLLIAMLASVLCGSVASAAPRQQQASSAFNANAQLLKQMVQHGQLAPSVKIVNTLAPTTIVQFPLFPSGIKQAFPDATALVTIVRGDRDDSTSDTVTVDVQKMPPNITFTIFFIELANKPFGNVQYVADLTTRGDGSGESIFHVITLVAFAMDARNPGTSQDQEGTTSGINLEHMGMWFSSLIDAQEVLNDTTLTGTIFDGGSPPLHAGPQAMTDGQDAPVF